MDKERTMRAPKAQSYGPQPLVRALKARSYGTHPSLHDWAGTFASSQYSYVLSPLSFNMKHTGHTSPVMPYE